MKATWDLSLKNWHGTDEASEELFRLKNDPSRTKDNKKFRALIGPEFEEMEYFWSEYEVKMSNKMSVISPSAIEKYKSQLIFENGLYFSSKTIKLTPLEIFESHPNSKFSLMIADNILVGYAIGFIKTSENNYAIKHVRSIMKGACTKTIQNLVNSYWNIKNLQFYPFENNDDPSFQLYVLKINDGAIGCYKKCGFEKVESPTINMKMILTKERYIEKYILPKTEKILQHRLISKQKFKDSSLVFL
jgi:hypothetical protein